MNSQPELLKKTLAVFMSFMMAVLPLTANAEVWGPDINMEARGGDQRTITTGEIMWPFIIGDQTGGFIDARVKRSNYNTDGQDLADSLEYNVGGGIKYAFDYAPLDLEPRTMVAGAYGYYDKLDTPFDNKFDQVTIGAELLGENLRLRSNYYSPEDRSVPISPTFFSGITYSGNSAYINRSQLVEKPLSGYDAELGLKLFDQPFTIWGLTKYHNFSATNVPNKVGYRYRLQGEFPLNGVMNGAHLVAGGEYIDNDNENLYPSESNGYIRFSLPLGLTDYDGQTSDSVNSVADRMTRRPERDIDIVTGAGNKRASRTKATDPSGDTYDITVVGRDWNDDQEGAGTFNNPAKLQNAPDQLEQGDILLIQSKDGITPANRSTTAFDGVTIDTTVRITGSNAPIALKNPETGNTYVAPLPGEANQEATLRSADHDGEDGALELTEGASGSTIDNLRMEGFNALKLTHTDNITIQNLSAKGFGQSSIVADSAAVTMINSSTQAPVTLTGGPGSQNATFVAQNWDGSDYSSDTEGAESNPNALVLDDYEGNAQVNNSNLNGRITLNNSDANLTVYNSSVTVQDGSETSTQPAILSRKADNTQTNLTATSLDSTIKAKNSSSNFTLTGATIDGTYTPSTITDRSTRSFDLSKYGGDITVHRGDIEGGIQAQNSDLTMTLNRSTLDAAGADTGPRAVVFENSSGDYIVSESTLTGGHTLSGSMNASFDDSTLTTNTGYSQALELSGSDEVAFTKTDITGTVGASDADGNLSITQNSTVDGQQNNSLRLDHNGTVLVDHSALNGPVAIAGTSGDTATADVAIQNSTLNTSGLVTDSALRFDHHAGSVLVQNLNNTISQSVTMNNQTGNVELNNIDINGDLIESKGDGFLHLTDSTVDGSGTPGQPAVDLRNRQNGAVNFDNTTVSGNTRIAGPTNGGDTETATSDTVTVRIENNSLLDGAYQTKGPVSTAIDNSSVNDDITMVGAPHLSLVDTTHDGDITLSGTAGSASLMSDSSTVTGNIDVTSSSNQAAINAEDHSVFEDSVNLSGVDALLSYTGNTQQTDGELTVSGDTLSVSMEDSAGTTTTIGGKNGGVQNGVVELTNNTILGGDLTANNYNGSVTINNADINGNTTLTNNQDGGDLSVFARNSAVLDGTVDISGSSGNSNLVVAGSNINNDVNLSNSSANATLDADASVLAGAVTVSGVNTQVDYDNVTQDNPDPAKSTPLQINGDTAIVQIDGSDVIGNATISGQNDAVQNGVFDLTGSSIQNLDFNPYNGIVNINNSSDADNINITSPDTVTLTASGPGPATTVIDGDVTVSGSNTTVNYTDLEQSGDLDVTANTVQSTLTNVSGQDNISYTGQDGIMESGSVLLDEVETNTNSTVQIGESANEYNGSAAITNSIINGNLNFVGADESDTANLSITNNTEIVNSVEADAQNVNLTNSFAGDVTVNGISDTVTLNSTGGAITGDGIAVNGNGNNINTIINSTNIQNGGIELTTSERIDASLSNIADTQEIGGSVSADGDVVNLNYDNVDHNGGLTVNANQVQSTLANSTLDPADYKGQGSAMDPSSIILSQGTEVGSLDVGENGPYAGTVTLDNAGVVGANMNVIGDDTENTYIHVQNSAEIVGDLTGRADTVTIDNSTVGGVKELNGTGNTINFTSTDSTVGYIDIDGGDDDVRAVVDSTTIDDPFGPAGDTGVEITSNGSVNASISGGVVNGNAEITANDDSVVTLQDVDFNNNLDVNNADNNTMEFTSEDVVANGTTNIEATTANFTEDDGTAAFVDATITDLGDDLNVTSGSGVQFVDLSVDGGDQKVNTDLTGLTLASAVNITNDGTEGIDASITNSDLSTATVSTTHDGDYTYNIDNNTYSNMIDLDAGVGSSLAVTNNSGPSIDALVTGEACIKVGESGNSNDATPVLHNTGSDTAYVSPSTADADTNDGMFDDASSGGNCSFP